MEKTKKSQIMKTNLVNPSVEGSVKETVTGYEGITMPEKDKGPHTCGPLYAKSARCLDY